jgi:hypothetical protein
MTTTEKLVRLHSVLEKIIIMIRLDPKNQWANKFANDLQFCEFLLKSNPSSDDIISISKSITDVYRGMGSFNDYEPAIFDPKSGRNCIINGTENFKKLANELFNIAVELRGSA